MASYMVQTVGSDWFATQIKIGPVVSLTGRVLQDVASAWDSCDCVAQSEADEDGVPYYSGRVCS